MLGTDHYDVIREIATSEQRLSLIGKIVAVSVRDDSSVDGVTADVQLRDSGKTLRGCPVAIGDGAGHIVVPQTEDWVQVSYFEADTEAPVVTGFVPTDDQLPAQATPGTWRHEFQRDSGDPLYVEAERADHSAGDPNVVRLGLKPDGRSDPTTEVAIDDSGDSTAVRVQTDGDVDVGADGDITIQVNGDAQIDADGQLMLGTEGGATPVARADHTHEYDDSTIQDTDDGSGTESTSTKSTTKPVEEGTDAKVE